MKHARPDYERFQDPTGLIPEDEPVMLFRAKDKHFPAVLFCYLQQLDRDPDVADEFYSAVERHWELVLDWQQKNGCQTPDMPFEED